MEEHALKQQPVEIGKSVIYQSARVMRQHFSGLQQQLKKQHKSHSQTAPFEPGNQVKVFQDRENEESGWGKRVVSEEVFHKHYSLK